MSWIGLLLIGVGLTDLVFSVRPRAIIPECVGAIALILTGLVCDLTSATDIVALVVMAAVVVAWGQTVTRGFGRGPAWLPLAVLGGGLAGVILASGQAGEAGGPFQTWLDDVALPVLADADADRVLLLAGVLLLQLSTGNVVVRLVLAATGTADPRRHGEPDDPEMRLKGGRLLGPMERIFIVSLGLAGHVTAASIVVAAKGLLRFPELSSRREQERIHQLTEYFLVGSFVSWLFALGSLVLLA